MPFYLIFIAITSPEVQLSTCSWLGLQLQFSSTSAEKTQELTVDAWISNDCKFYFPAEVDVLVLDFTRNAVCIMSEINRRRISSATCETKKEKGQRPITNTWRTRKSKGHLPGRTLLLVIGRTLIRKGRPPICVIGRTLTREGQLPMCPPVLVTGGTLIRKGQQFAWVIWRLQEPSSSGLDNIMWICASRRSRYALVEPKGSVILRRIKDWVQLFARAA